jgi:hypothetical protein
MSHLQSRQYILVASRYSFSFYFSTRMLICYNPTSSTTASIPQLATSKIYNDRLEIVSILALST